MANNRVIKATIDIGANIGDFQSALHKVQTELNRLTLSDSVKTDFDKIFGNIAGEIQNIKKLTANNEINLIDEKNVANSIKKVNSLYSDLVSKLESRKVKTSLFKEDQQVINSLNGIVKKYNDAIKASGSAVEKATQKYNEQLSVVKRIQSALNNARAKEIQATAHEDEVQKSYEQEAEAIKKKIQAQEEEIKKNEEATRTARESLEAERQHFKETYKNSKNTNAGWGIQFAKQYADQIKKVQDEEQKLLQSRQDLANLNEQAKGIEESYNQEKAKAAEATQKATEAVQQQETALKTANKSLSAYQGALTRIKGTEFKKLADDISAIPWEKFGIERSEITSYEILVDKIKIVAAQSQEAASKILTQLDPALKQGSQASKNMSLGLDQASTSMQQMSENAKQLDQLRSRVIQFFSIGNAVMLFRRAINSAMNTVKELDKAMTETAVVTDFSVGDMWERLPEYTQRANELGLAIKDVYEASTLYYQQGLKTNEVTAVTNATLRMARIAGLDAADATDRMTNALRGFNMEINEANADNIADVYSKLAAISASNVDEISTAMTKVASLANSANMQFETTSAFLAQIIETTRESAETAGTALKTVVARFSEVKDLYSKGELLGTDEEGEEIDVNKVSKALRTASINLNEFLTGQRGLDEIFMELASKWDQLDIVQQRYIATMAAGSRQQSRFIALMSDYKRTQELTAAAQNASGAANEQYNKTLESLETKLNKLKNAWDEFLMSITNSDIIKGAVDLLTGLVGALNKVTDALSGGNGILKSITAITLSVGGMKLGKNLFNGIFGNPLTGAKSYMSQVLEGFNSPQLLGQAEKTGAKVGSGFIAGFSSLKSLSWKGFGRAFIGKTDFTASDLGITEIDFRDTRLNFRDIEIPQSVRDSLASQVESIKSTLGEGVSQEVLDNYDSLTEKLKNGQFEEARQQAANMELQLKLTGEQADSTGQHFAATSQQAQAFGQALSIAGGAIVTIATILEKAFPGLNKTAIKTIKNVGMALMTVPTILKVVSSAVSVFSKEVSASIMSIPIIGWVTAAITVLVTLGTILADVIETPAEAAENAKKALESATEAAQEATTKLNGLIEAQNKLAETKDKFDGLTRGTEAWSKAVEENNAWVLELLSNYKELKVENKDGILTITNMDQVIEAQTRRNQSARVGEIGAQINNTEKQIDVFLENVASKGFHTGRDVMRNILEGVLSAEYQSMDDVRNYYQQTGVSEAIIQISFDELQQEAFTYQSMLNEIDAFSEALQAEAVQLANLTSDQEKYAESVSNLDDTTKNLKSTIESEYKDKYQNWDEQKRIEYDAWAKERYGESAYVTSKGDIRIKDNDNESIAFQDARREFVADKTTDQLTLEIEKVVKGVELLSSKNNAQAQATAKAFEESGTLLNLADLQAIVGSKVNPFDLTSTDAFRTYAEQIYENNGGEALGNKEDFIRNLSEAFFTALTNYRNAGVTDTSSLSSVPASVIGAFNTNFKDYIQDIPTFDNIINSMLKGMGITEAGDITKVLNALSGVDLSSRRDIESATGILETVGLDVASEEWDKFIEFIVRRTGAVDEINLDHFKENLDSIKKTIDGLKSGEHGNVFTDEEYAAIRPYVDDEDFQETAYGVIYVGDDFESLGDKIQQAISDGFEETSKILENKINLAEVYEKASGEAQSIVEERGKSASLNLRERSFDQYVQLETLKNIIQTYGEDTKYLQIPGLADLATSGKIDNLDSKQVIDYLSKIEAIVAEQSKNEDKQGSLAISQRIEGGIDKLINQWRGNNYDTTALTQLIKQLNLPDQIANSLTQNLSSLDQKQAAIRYQAAEELSARQAEGLSLEELVAFAETLERTKDIATDVAIAVAAANTKLNTGLKSIIDSYETVNELIDNGPLGKGQPLIFTSSEEFKKFDTLRKDLQTALDLSFDLSDSFFESAENMELLRQVANGTTEEQEAAFEQLQKAAAFNFVASIDFGEAQEEVDGFLDALQNLEIPDLEVGAVLEDEQFIAALKGLAAISEDAAKAIGSALGLKQQFVPTGTQTVYMPEEQSIGGGERFIDIEGQGRTLKQVTVPTYTMEWVSTGSKKTDWSNLSSSRDASRSKGSKSGSGSSSKPKQWKNPYDELYNLQEKINSALRERERLEHRYQDMLKDHTKTAQDLTKNSYTEIASLKKQLALQKQMLAGRQRQMSKVLSETYEDSEGNRRTYSAMGVQKYGWYEAETQTVHIEWDKINQVTDENLGGAIESYISRLEEIRDQIQDTEDAIHDIDDDLWEIQERGKQEYIDFEQRIYDALISQQQKYIDALDKINSSISEATNKTIKSIQDQIAAERQARENEQAREDIYDKEMRLAYLQRDTSGANALEIQKLQEEIGNDQLSYQDRIIDQTIQQMQDDAARAEEQRQAQIDIMQAQLEYAQENGLYWATVEQLLRDGIDDSGSMIFGSNLDNLLKENDNIKAMSRIGEKNWQEELARNIASAMQGRGNWEMSIAKERGDMTLANGTKLTYNKNNDTWTDAKGNQYTNFSWDSDQNAFTASVVKQAATPKSSSSTAKSSGTDNSVKSYTVRDGDSLWAIATREYGNGNKAYDIARYNGIGNADLIYTGQVLRLPKKFAKGGLADFTGPAWLDGTKSHPEMVLNAADTQNLITLKNVLSSILQGGANSIMGVGDNYFDINIAAEVGSDYDVDRLADRIKKQIYDDATYRNVNAISYIR